MKQFFKKFKLKHAARLFLFLFALFVLCIPCSAAVLTTVSFTNDEGLPYGAEGINVYYDESNFVQLNVGSSAEVVFESSDDPDSIIHVVNGFIDFGDGPIDVSDYLTDGAYQVFGVIHTSKDIQGSDVFSPEINGVPIYIVDEILSYGLAYYESIPSKIDVNLTHYTLDDYPYGLLTSYFLLIPYEEPTVVDNISNVWSNILLWITLAINTVTGIFWTGTHLTLIGTLSLVGVSIALCLLIYNKVKDFLKLQ